MAIEIGAGITIGPGISFTPPGAPPPAPWSAKTITYTNNSAFVNQQFSFGDTGQKIMILTAKDVGGGTFNAFIQSYNLTSAWDVTTLSPTVSNELNVNTSPNGSNFNINAVRYTLAWKPDGTQACGMIGEIGDNNFQFFKFTFLTPWGVTSLASTTIGSSITGSAGLVSSGSGLIFNNDGTRAYHMSGGKLYQWTVPTAYDLTSITSATTTFYDLKNNISGSDNATQIAFNTVGNGIFIGEWGDAFTGKAYQLKLNTAWDVTSIDITSLNTTSLASSGISYMSINVAVLGDNDTKLYIPAFDAGFIEKLLQFAVS
jgi:hypothetical protein